mmetsp:Transcript_1867/g.4220  ORF Transcript_1867/g.4220 Transcript_1867/m.4220 type:complete len:99 (+) Transcript_1867:422-718(+)
MFLNSFASFSRRSSRNKQDSALLRPVDLALGLALPLHSHITCNMVISDYVPPSARRVARAGLAGLTAAAVLGLLKVNLTGPGITGAVRQLWKKEEAKQ